MENSVKIILKRYLEQKKYLEYNEMLRREIISIFVKKIQKKDTSFLYSNVIELLEHVEIYLSTEDIQNCRYFYDILKRDYEPEILAGYLTELYKELE